MRIAHVIGTFPPHIGGMGQVAFDECVELSKRGHEITVFTMWYPGYDVVDDSQLPFKVVSLYPKIMEGDAGWVPQLTKQLKRFEVVHLHYPWYGGAEWVWLAKKIYGQKYVVTYHMQAAPKGVFKRAVQTVYDKLFTTAILKNAEKIILVNKNYFADNIFLKKVNPEKIVELSNGVDTEVFRPLLLTDAQRTATPPNLPLEKGGSKKTILFVGNLMPVKRLDLLLEALRKLSDREVRLIIVGDGYNEDDYKQKTEEDSLQDRVEFVGRCDKKEKLAEYYNRASCLVVPSDAESFSLVALEAMASGTPVIASDVPGMRGRIEEGEDGLLFERGNVADLKLKIEDFFRMNEEERKKMGERGREKVVRKYSLEKHVNRLEEIYRNIEI